MILEENMIAVVVIVLWVISFFQSREGSNSFNKSKMSVLTFLVKKVQAFRAVYFVRIREKPLS